MTDQWREAEHTTPLWMGVNGKLNKCQNKKSPLLICKRKTCPEISYIWVSPLWRRALASDPNDRWLAYYHMTKNCVPADTGESSPLGPLHTYMIGLVCSAEGSASASWCLGILPPRSKNNGLTCHHRGLCFGKTGAWVFSPFSSGDGPPDLRDMIGAFCGGLCFGKLVLGYTPAAWLT